MSRYFNKRMASAVCVYVECPTTGMTIDGVRGDDKVLCNCPDAASKGGTHLISKCAASSVEQYMVERHLTDNKERVMTKIQKITLKISLCLTSMESDQNDLLVEAKVFDAIRAAAILKWPACQVGFPTLQDSDKHGGDEFARCWVDGERDDSQAVSLLHSIDWSNKRLYQKKGSRRRGGE